MDQFEEVSQLQYDNEVLVEETNEMIRRKKRMGEFPTIEGL